MTDLRISLTTHPTIDGECPVIRLTGEADMRATQLRDALAAGLAARSRLLVVDLSALTFIDSGATQVIVTAYQKAGRESGKLALVCDVDPVLRVLSLMGVDRLIHVYASVDEAVIAARTL